MQCDGLREAISARIDGEDPGLPDGALDAHLGFCAGCRAWQQRAHAVTRRARLGGLFLDHDLTPKVIAAAPAVATRRGRRFIQQAGRGRHGGGPARGRHPPAAARPRSPRGSCRLCPTAAEMARPRLAGAARGRSHDGRTGSRQAPAGRESAPGGQGTAATREVSLSIEGMTCAACAVRIEKKLNKLDEVRATVNYATATARVCAPAAMPVAELIGAVERAGYTARPTAMAPGERPGAPSDPEDWISRPPRVNRRPGRQARRLPAPPADRGADLLHPADRPVADAVPGPVAAVPRLAVAARRAARRRWPCGARGRSTGPR